jgi:hypothetical protein
MMKVLLFLIEMTEHDERALLAGFSLLAATKDPPPGNHAALNLSGLQSLLSGI